MSECAIEVTSLRKRFGAKWALHGLDLAVPQGSVFGFLGTNGAGKTTAIRAIMGHLRPDGGEVRVLGRDPWEHDEATWRRVAYVSENMALPGWMRPEDATRFCSSLYPNWDAQLERELLGEFELRGAARFRALSKGQKRRLCILLALCQNADLLVMDEPASGLDTVARRDFLERVLDVARSEGRTVFFASHILTDVERVVDRIAIIVQGHLRLDGELDSLKQRVRTLRLPPSVRREVVEKHFQILRFAEHEDRTEVVVLDFDEERLDRLYEEAGDSGRGQELGMNLEDLFVEIKKAWKGDQTCGD